MVVSRSLEVGCGVLQVEVGEKVEAGTGNRQRREPR